MRGKPFHNKIVQEAGSILLSKNWQVFTEHGCKINGSTVYFDLFAIKGPHKLACQIETTSRNVIRNVLGAQAACIPVWFIAPNRKVRKQIITKLNKNHIGLTNKRINVLLLSDMEKELADYMPA